MSWNKGTLLGCMLLLVGVALADDSAIRLQSNRINPGPPREIPAMTVDATAMALAFGVPQSMLVSATYEGPPSAAMPLANLGILAPIEGSAFAYMSTGVVGTIPEPGTDFAPLESEVGDEATLTFELAVPAGEYLLSFRYVFLSAEAPEYVGSQFDDQFSARVTEKYGTGLVALTSVNSAAFMMASMDNAAGTGFNLFTPDPEEVDDQFGFGLPDAGLTDWILATERVLSDGTLVVELHIEDVSDGLLDSAVILDGFSVVPLEAVDFFDSFIAQDGSLITDPQILHEGGIPRVGVVADGEARLLLRMLVPSAGTVRFRVDYGPEDGFVHGLNDGPNPPSTFVEVASVLTPRGWVAFAVYRAPEEFDRGFLDEDDRERRINIAADFDPDQGLPANDIDLHLTVVRPPVLLVHGMRSNQSTWTMPLASNTLFDVYRSDYRTTAVSNLATNTDVPGRDIDNILRWYRGRDLAIVQVDVVAHSLGGALSRRHIASSGYYDAATYNRGDINRLITLDSPHAGSLLANFIVSSANHPVVGGLTREFLTRIGAPFSNGLFSDLIRGSAVLDAIPVALVPGHALVGNSGDDVAGPATTWAHTLVNLWVPFISFQDPFNGEEHDLIIDRASQEGGMLPEDYTLFGGIDGLHLFNTNSELYSARIVELLHLPVSDSAFGFFPSPSTIVFPPGPPAAPPDDAPMMNVTGTYPNGLIITSPPPGGIVSAGSTVFVDVVDPFGRVDRALLVGPDSGDMDLSPPFDFALQIPATAAGPYTIQAFGVDGSEYTSSAPVTLQVGVSYGMMGVTLLPRRPQLRGTGDRLQLDVISSHTDGLDRNVTHGSTGTTYDSAPTGIVSISSDGLVTGLMEGTCSLVATNGVHQDSITVTVLDGTGFCGDGIVDLGEQCDDGLDNSNTEPGACREDCTTGICGDGVLDPGEQCDSGLGNSDTTADACRQNCMSPRCGDGVLDSSEQCDDGNNADGDGCSAICTVEALFCGNGVREPEEECDEDDFGFIGPECSFGYVGFRLCSEDCEIDNSCCLDILGRESPFLVPAGSYGPVGGDPIGGQFESTTTAFESAPLAYDDDEENPLFGDHETFASGEFFRDQDDPDGAISVGQFFSWGSAIASGKFKVTVSTEQIVADSGRVWVYYSTNSGHPWTQMAVHSGETPGTYYSPWIEDVQGISLRVAVIGRADPSFPNPPDVQHGRARIYDVRFLNGPTCPCDFDSDCDDGTWCNGAERCEPVPGFSGSYCHPGVPPNCDDGNNCTLESCSQSTDYCVWETIECDDGLFCNGAEVCDGHGGCLRAKRACAPNQVCDELLDTCITPAPCPEPTTCVGTGTCELGGCQPTGAVSSVLLFQRACMLPSGQPMDCGAGESLRLTTAACELCECCDDPGPTCPCPIDSCGQKTNLDCTTSSSSTEPSAPVTLMVGRSPTGTTLSWTVGGLVHDVVAGDLGLLHATGGNFALSTAECLADATQATWLEHSDIPLARSSFYLVRPETGDYATYDTRSDSQVGSRNGEIEASPYSCY